MSLEPTDWDGYLPITDLPHDSQPLASPEIRALDGVWREQRDRLEELDELKRFRERLVREWSIETGIVERVYEIDRGVTELLIERGIHENLLSGATDRDAATVAAILWDHQAAIDGVFDFVKGSRPLTCGYIKELHALLTRHQSTVQGRDPMGREVEIPLRKGEWKMLPNNPTRPDGVSHKYCPPDQVQGEMERLLEWHGDHVANDVPPEVESAWLHHRFTQIHPFQDGNGRVARTLASLVLIRAGWFPLSIHRDQKTEYIDALETADQGDLSSLTRLFARIARDALIRAMSVADQSERELAGLDQLVAAARDRLIIKGAVTTATQSLNRAKAAADDLCTVAVQELERVRHALQEGVASELPDMAITTETARNGDKRTNWYRNSQVSFARKELHYFANVGAYSSWARIRVSQFDSNTRYDLVVCLHGMGKNFRGLIAAVAFLQQFGAGEEGGSMAFLEEQLVQPELFQLNYGEPVEQARLRFTDWIGDSIRIGLGQWLSELGG